MEDTQKLKYKAKLINGKLMLASSDIQVGDKARSIEFPEEEFTVSSIEMGSGKDHYPKELLVWNRKDEQVSYWRTLANTFKVIGEISSDALSYVKEGQEFDEEGARAVLGIVKR